VYGKIPELVPITAMEMIGGRELEQNCYPKDGGSAFLHNVCRNMLQSVL